MVDGVSGNSSAAHTQKRSSKSKSTKMSLLSGGRTPHPKAKRKHTSETGQTHRSGSSSHTSHLKHRPKSTGTESTATSRTHSKKPGTTQRATTWSAAGTSSKSSGKLASTYSPSGTTSSHSVVLGSAGSMGTSDIRHHPRGFFDQPSPHADPSPRFVDSKGKGRIPKELVDFHKSLQKQTQNADGRRGFNGFADIQPFS